MSLTKNVGYFFVLPHQLGQCKLKVEFKSNIGLNDARNDATTNTNTTLKYHNVLMK